MSERRKELRGVFPEYENSAWALAMQNFPNQVPRFATKAECIEFTRSHMNKSSNPADPGLKHSISTLTDWNQVETYLLPQITHYRSLQNDVLPDAQTLDSNIFYSTPDANHSKSTDVDGMITDMDIDRDKVTNQASSYVYSYLQSRLNLPIHSVTTELSTENTLRYLFDVMRCGIFVMIKNNKLVIFCPFVNKNYTNNWNGRLQLSGSGATVEEYYRDKDSRENFIPDMSKWWANGKTKLNIC